MAVPRTLEELVLNQPKEDSLGGGVSQVNQLNSNVSYTK